MTDVRVIVQLRASGPEGVLQARVYVDGEHIGDATPTLIEDGVTFWGDDPLEAYLDVVPLDVRDVVLRAIMEQVRGQLLSGDEL